jgi:hypothetical protein
MLKELELKKEPDGLEAHIGPIDLHHRRAADMAANKLLAARDLVPIYFCEHLSMFRVRWDRS